MSAVRYGYSQQSVCQYSGAHEGLKQAIGTVLSGTTWQRCRVHFMRNLLATVPHGAREAIAAIVRTIFAQPDHGSALLQLRKVADGLRSRFPQAAALLEDAAEDVLAYRHLPLEHQRQLHSTNPLERLNKEDETADNADALDDGAGDPGSDYITDDKLTDVEIQFPPLDGTLPAAEVTVGRNDSRLLIGTWPRRPRLSIVALGGKLELGKSVIIKGELSASEDLTLDGHMEGRVTLPDHTLSIGPGANIQASISAKVVVIMGAVTGNVAAGEKIEIRATGSVTGDLMSPRLVVAEGGSLRGKVEMPRAVV